tara:strand:- start:37 stop:213 length:177 start_codon:yes stop_codon:yes gene_type:complete
MKYYTEILAEVREIDIVNEGQNTFTIEVQDFIRGPLRAIRAKSEVFTNKAKAKKYFND